MFFRHLFSKRSSFFNLPFLLSVVCLIFVYSTISPAQKLAPSLERGRAQSMLKAIKKDIIANYYDPDLNGFDLEEHFIVANDKIDQAVSLSHAYGIITQAIVDFDSNVTFYPPATTIDIDFGVYMRMIGDRCYVIAVKPGSDAEAKGAKPGDEIMSLDGFRPTRKNFDIMSWYYSVITSANKVRVIAKRSDEKELRPFDITGKVTKSKAVLTLEDLINPITKQDLYIKYKPYNAKKIGGTTILNFPGLYITASEIDSVMKNHLSGSNNLILDLRGNIGDFYSAFVKPDKVEKLTGYFFDNAVKIADLKGRKETKSMQSRPPGKNVFKGKLVVLIDSDTSPEGQIFARLIQLEKRGIVVGDQTKGKVYQSRFINEELGVDSSILFAVGVPVAKVIMSDGNTLEQVGVTPDELLLPSNTDLSAGYDPVLAHALETTGVRVTPEEAGKVFPVEWRK